MTQNLLSIPVANSGFIFIALENSPIDTPSTLYTLCLNGVPLNFLHDLLSVAILGFMKKAIKIETSNRIVSTIVATMKLVSSWIQATIFGLEIDNVSIRSPKVVMETVHSEQLGKLNLESLYMGMTFAKDGQMYTFLFTDGCGIVTAKSTPDINNQGYRLIVVKCKQQDVGKFKRGDIAKALGDILGCKMGHVSKPKGVNNRVMITSVPKDYLVMAINLKVFYIGDCLFKMYEYADK